MPNVRFLRDLVGAGATIVGESFGGGGDFSLPHLLSTVQPSERALTAPGGTISGRIRVDFGAAKSFDGIWLGSSLFWTGATMRFRCADTIGGLDTATGADDSGAVSVWRASGRPAVEDYPSLVTDRRFRGGDHFYRFASVRVRRYLRIDIVDSGNPNTFTGFGILRVGLVQEPSRNFGFGWRIGLRSAAQQIASPGGAMHLADGPDWREIALPMQWLGQSPPSLSDFQRFYENLRWIRGARDLVAIPDPDADHDWHLKAVCGVPVNAPDFLNRILRHWSAELVLRELI